MPESKTCSHQLRGTSTRRYWTKFRLAIVPASYEIDACEIAAQTGYLWGVTHTWLVNKTLVDVLASRLARNIIQTLEKDHISEFH